MAEGIPLKPGTVLQSKDGRYVVVSTLGSGGYGITYLVEATVKVHNVDVTVQLAVKELFIASLCERESMTQQISYSDPVRYTVTRARRAFIKEAQRLQSLGVEHPNIVKINEVFEANNTAYYVMEYLRGDTLRDYVGRWGYISIDETLELMRPVIDAVAALHNNNITHYDLKPTNIILVTNEDGSLRPVIIDFGLSKHYDENGCDTSTINTSGYSKGYSPIEQYAGLRRFTPQADVYALAATIYFCLTGNIPDAADTFNSNTLDAILGDKAPDRVIEVLKRAMAYSKDDRIADAGALYNELYSAKTEE